MTVGEATRQYQATLEIRRALREAQEYDDWHEADKELQAAERVMNTAWLNSCIGLRPVPSTPSPEQGTGGSTSS